MPDAVLVLNQHFMFEVYGGVGKFSFPRKFRTALRAVHAGHHFLFFTVSQPCKFSEPFLSEMIGLWLFRCCDITCWLVLWTIVVGSLGNWHRTDRSFWIIFSCEKRIYSSFHSITLWSNDTALSTRHRLCDPSLSNPAHSAHVLKLLLVAMVTGAPPPRSAHPDTHDRHTHTHRHSLPLLHEMQL